MVACYIHVALTFAHTQTNTHARTQPHTRVHTHTRARARTSCDRTKPQGFESRWDALSAHSKWVNTAFQHYLHHARSIFGKPYHTGFFFKVWDNMFGSVWKDECFCVRCEQAKGNRTREQYDKIEKPDYSVLLSPQFWLHGPPSIVDAIDADDVDAVSKQKAL